MPLLTAYAQNLSINTKITPEFYEFRFLELSPNELPIDSDFVDNPQVTVTMGT